MVQVSNIPKTAPGESQQVAKLSVSFIFFFLCQAEKSLEKTSDIFNIFNTFSDFFNNFNQYPCGAIFVEVMYTNW